MPKICLLVQQILEQGISLFDLSSLLRRPSITDKYIRSANPKLNTAASSDSEVLPRSVDFSSLDKIHIMEKVLQWRGLTKSRGGVEFEDEKVATVGKGFTGDGIEDIMWFCRRLARANTRRRDQLRYWIDNPYDPKQDMANSNQLESANLPQVSARKVADQKSQTQASTRKPPSSNTLHNRPESAISKQGFSVAAVSDIHDTNTNVRPRTVYALTSIGQGWSNSVPDPPKPENGESSFPCPYCGTMLQSSEMLNRKSWK